MMMGGEWQATRLFWTTRKDNGQRTRFLSRLGPSLLCSMFTPVPLTFAVMPTKSASWLLQDRRSIWA
jgi:hypothetical protein